MPKSSKRMSLLGLGIDNADSNSILDLIEGVVDQRKKAIILYLNIHGVNLALKKPSFFKFINQARLVFCDGDGLRWGLKFLGYRPPPKVTYNKWIWSLAEFCSKKKYRLFLLGAATGIAEEAAKRFYSRYPEIQIAGTHHGFFEKKGKENEKVIHRINNAKTDILIVCFGMPLQEEWLKDNVTRIKAHVFLNGGAALDYASGQLKMAPAWMIQLQMEWLYRLLQEPQRLFIRYIIGNPLFLFRVFLERLKR